jgi:diaminopimelate epimerase
MQGCGNDFILVNRLEERLEDEDLPELARRWCDRHFGVGADGLVLVEPSKQANYRMRMLNPDGTESEICGNSIRCFAKYVFDRRLHADTLLKVETNSGVRLLKLRTRGREVDQVRVDMGMPILERRDIPLRGDGPSPVVSERLQAGGRKFEVTCLSMGNPHCIVIVEDVDNYPVERYGPEIETHKLFPKRTNVEFVQPLSNSELKQRTWERGAGETLASGTGASAAVVACALTNRTARRVTAHLPGGDLFVEWTGDDHVYLNGPAAEVFNGEL